MRARAPICLPLALILAACEPMPAPTVVISEIATTTRTQMPTPSIVEKTRQPTIAANKMQWESDGGGQITFSITLNGQAFDVHVTSCQFKNRDDRFTITAESGAPHRAMSAVMQDQRSIGLHAPDEPPRGSWTTLRFGDGEPFSHLDPGERRARADAGGLSQEFEQGLVGFFRQSLGQ